MTEPIRKPGVAATKKPSGPDARFWLDKAKREIEKSRKTEKYVLIGLGALTLAGALALAASSKGCKGEKEQPSAQAGETEQDRGEAQKAWDSLYTSIQNNNLGKAKRVLEKSSSELDKEGLNNLLLEACKLGRKSIAEELMAYGADVNYVTEAFVQKGECMDMVYAYPLRVAVFGGHLETVKMLLANGASAKWVGKQWSPLHQAVSKKNYVMAELLLAHGADANAMDPMESTPLIVAAENGDVKSIELLLKNGAEADAAGYGYTALHKAVSERNYDAAMALLAHGADEEGKIEETPLMMAAGNGDIKMAKLLLKHGADEDASDKQEMTVLMYASLSGNPEMTKLLLKEGAKVNAGDKKGRTALIYAAGNGYLKICDALIKEGAEINEKDNDGKSALWYANEKKHKQTADFLITNGAKY